MSRFFPDNTNSFLKTDKVKSGILLNDGSSEWTFIAWIYPITPNPPQAIIFRSSTIAAGLGMMAQPQLRVAFSGANLNVNPTPTLKTSIWSSIAIAWDGGTDPNKVDLYQNLILAAHSTNTGGTGSYTDNGNQVISIGNTGTASQANQFVGQIAYIQIFNKKISFMEISHATYYPGSIRRALSGFWPLFGAGGIEPDLSVNKNHATNISGAVKGFSDPPISGLFFPRRPNRFPYTTPTVGTTKVTFDVASSSGYQASLSTYSWNHTVANKSNRFLEVSVGIFLTGSVSSITYAGVAMKFIRADVKGVYRSEIWGLVAPATGTNSIVVTLNTSLTSIGNAQSYYNVDQNEPVDIDQGNTGSASPATGSITPEADSCMLLANLVASTASGITSAGGQTSRTTNNGALGTDNSDEQGVVTPIATKTFTWNNLGALDNWAVSIIAIQPVITAIPSSVIVPKRKTRLLMDVGL